MNNNEVMRKLNEDGSNKRMFNHLKRLMRKEQHMGKSIKVLNSSGITVSDEQEDVKEVDRFWGEVLCINRKATQGNKKRDDWEWYDK